MLMQKQNQKLITAELRELINGGFIKPELGPKEVIGHLVKSLL